MNKVVRKALLMCFLLPVSALAQEAVDGISFANSPGKLFVPLRPIAKALGLAVTWDEATSAVGVGSAKWQAKELRKLFDGTKLLHVRQLEQAGAKVSYDRATETATLAVGERRVAIQRQEQRVEVSLREQRLRAWQGETLVIDTPISSGRRGHATPTGSFSAGPYKAKMHYSSIYDNAPMPYSVQVNGDIFIHGYASVPRRPASHGCIRMPVYGANAAKFFYDWVKVGTPVEIRQDFSMVASRPSAND